MIIEVVPGSEKPGVPSDADLVVTWQRFWAELVVSFVAKQRSCGETFGRLRI